MYIGGEGRGRLSRDPRGISQKAWKNTLNHKVLTTVRGVQK